MSHGHTSGNRTPEYMAWQNMVQRCTNEKFRQYKNYGGRGIKVFDGWLGRGGFEAFFAEVGPRPSRDYSLDRKANDVGYQPGNVRWATRIVQNNNASKNVLLTVNDTTRTLAEWSDKTGINHSTLRYRLKIGWSPERIVSTPLRRHLLPP